jgi:hypothetical protein
LLHGTLKIDYQVYHSKQGSKKNNIEKQRRKSKSKFLSQHFLHQDNPKTNPKNGKMEEDVEPKDEDGVDGRRVSRLDGWVGDLGVVGV